MEILRRIIYTIHRGRGFPSFFFLMICPPPRSTLLPYTPLFLSPPFLALPLPLSFLWIASLLIPISSSLPSSSLPPSPLFPLSILPFFFLTFLFSSFNIASNYYYQILSHDLDLNIFGYEERCDR